MGTDDTIQKEIEIWKKYQRAHESAKRKPRPDKAEGIARARYWNAIYQLHGQAGGENERKAEDPVDPYVEAHYR